jgi:hypothetical protein
MPTGSTGFQFGSESLVQGLFANGSAGMWIGDEFADLVLVDQEAGQQFDEIALFWGRHEWRQAVRLLAAAFLHGFIRWSPMAAWPGAYLGLHAECPARRSHHPLAAGHRHMRLADPALLELGSERNDDE